MNTATGKHRKRITAVIILALTLVFTQQVLCDAQEYNTSLSVLIDFSKTYYNKSTKNLIKDLLRRGKIAVEEFASISESPVKISFLAINDLSLTTPPISTFIYHRKIFGGNKEGVITRPADLKNYLELCKEIILKKEPSAYTDISGAIDLATRITAGQRRGEKSILILSDLKEDPRPGTQTAELKLDGYNVVILYRILGQDARKPSELDERLSAWKNKLTKAGARKVTCLHDSILDIHQIIRGLQN